MSTQQHINNWTRSSTSEHWYRNTTLELPSWYKILDYPYNGWVHIVSLNTWYAEYLDIPSTWASRLDLSLEFPQEWYGLNFSYKLIDMSSRSIRIGWERDDEQHKGDYRLYSNQQEAEKGHKKLVQYLEMFMLSRRLFDKDFAEMEVQRQLYLDAAGILVAQRGKRW